MEQDDQIGIMLTWNEAEGVFIDISGNLRLTRDEFRLPDEELVAKAGYPGQRVRFNLFVPMGPWS